MALGGAGGNAKGGGVAAGGSSPAASGASGLNGGAPGSSGAGVGTNGGSSGVNGVAGAGGTPGVTTLVTCPALPGAITSPLYSVTVAGKPLFVEKLSKCAPEMQVHYAHGSLSGAGSAMVTVTVSESFSSYTVSPKSRKLTTSKNGNTITFATGPNYLIVKFDSKEVQAGRGLGANLRIANNDEVFVDLAPFYYLYGFVGKTGEYPLLRALTVQQAISIGGGLSTLGSEWRIRIKRRQGNGQTYEVPASLDDQVEAGDTIIVSERIF